MPSSKRTTESNTKYTTKKLRGKHTIKVDNQIIRWRKKYRTPTKIVEVPKVEFFEDTKESKPIELKVKFYNFFEDETVE